LEGGRSRTGKLLPPKLGLLNMVVEAALSVPNREVFFVPVSIGYDRLVEGGAYVHELTGGEKQKEDARGLLRTTRVLRGRYGRLNIQFGEILPFSDQLRASLGGEHGGAASPSPEENGVKRTLNPAKRRALVARLAHRVMAEINGATAVTPGAVVAMAMLNHPRRGISDRELLETSARLIKMLTRLGARISRPLVAQDDKRRDDAIHDAARLFMDADIITATVPGQRRSAQARAERAKIYTGPDVVYLVPDEKRLSLDLSKNIIVHFFVPRALVATALLTPPGQAEAPSMGAPIAPTPDAIALPSPGPSVVTRAILEERVQKLSRLFKFEFMFRADATFEQNFAETLADMAAAGELAVTPAGDVTFGAGHDGLSARGWIRFYASVARTFLEGYRVAARSLSSLVKGPMGQKDLAKRAIAVGERMFLEGEIERREAVSQPVIENALLAFADQGYVAVASGKVSLSESFATAAAVRAIEGRIASYLSTEPLTNGG
jgi:glycerol-3-phosphate O-acyltransferase